MIISDVQKLQVNKNKTKLSVIPLYGVDRVTFFPLQIVTFREDNSGIIHLVQITGF